MFPMLSTHIIILVWSNVTPKMYTIICLGLELTTLSSHSPVSPSLTTKPNIPNHLLLLKMGNSQPLFCLFSSFQYSFINIVDKIWRWLDSTRGSLVSETTALPAEPQTQLSWRRFERRCRSVFFERNVGNLNCNDSIFVQVWVMALNYAENEFWRHTPSTRTPDNIPNLRAQREKLALKSDCLKNVEKQWKCWAQKNVV